MPALSPSSLTLPTASTCGSSGVGSGPALAVPAIAAIAPAAIPADATIFLMLKTFRSVEKWNGARFEGEGIGRRPGQEVLGGSDADVTEDAPRSLRLVGAQQRRGGNAVAADVDVLDDRGHVRVLSVDGLDLAGHVFRVDGRERARGRNVSQLTTDVGLRVREDVRGVGVRGATQAEQYGGAAEGNGGPRDGLPEVHRRESVAPGPSTSSCVTQEGELLHPLRGLHSSPTVQTRVLCLHTV